MLRRAVIALLAVAALSGACSSDSQTKPAGTTADPVEVCERVGDVCRFDGSKLGVCVQNAAGDALVCQSQH